MSLLLARSQDHTTQGALSLGPITSSGQDSEQPWGRKNDSKDHLLQRAQLNLTSFYFS